MADKPIINIVGTVCPAQDEARFNKWYNEVHIPMLRKYKGLKGVTRYKIACEAPGSAQYIAVYNFDSVKDFEAFGKSPEFAAAIKEMNQSWPKGLSIVSRVQYEVIQNW
jgi:uncharacterized protein (TIGR02118 family)